MSIETWWEDLHREVSQANARTTSIFAKLQDTRRQLEAKLERITDKVGGGTDARERRTSVELHARVLDAFRRRQFSSLSVREQRYAAKQFEHVPAAEMQPFLAAHPSNWNTFASQCFRRFESFAQLQDRAAYTRLLCLAPESLRYLYVTGRPQDILVDRGPTAVAQLIHANDLCEAQRVLQGCGFDPTWDFTAIALAMWARIQVDQDGTFAAAWDSVTRNASVEAMLLPPLRGVKRSWFSPSLRPARIRGGVVSTSVFVSALFRAAYSRGVEPAEWNAFTENLLQSEFGDPRVPPESKGWSNLRRFDEASYFKFLELLISEDLSVFFEHAMSETRRKEFWLRYTKSVRRTVCILDRAMHERLTARLAGADKKLSAAMSRARKFKNKSGAHAFCLYFDQIVVVEFSEKGNAAQIYDRALFDAHFQSELETNQCPNHTHLKNPKIARDRIIHTHQTWESATRNVLARMGISPG
jgi:hypothetical protein